MDDAPPVGDGCAALGFTDPALDAAVRQQLGVAEGDEIDADALAGMTMLMADGVGITDLSGIECAAALEYVFVRDNEITDVTPLVGLEVLQHAHLGGNRITDLSPLSGHPTLFTLKAEANEIATIANLADVPQLANLDVSDNPIADLGQFSGLSGIRSLRIERTQVDDLSALASLPQLDNVYVNGAALTNLASLPSLSQLTGLFAADNAIADATCTAALPSLRELDLAGNQLATVEGLSAATLTSTPNLVLDRNPLDGLQSLESLPIRRLSIDEVGVADMTSLAAIDGPLVELSARGNGIVDVTPIASIATLDLANNAIADLSPFVGQTIEYLDLSNNQIVDGSLIAEIELAHCGYIALAGNPLQDEATIVDQLCDANINVVDECQPAACDPCGGAPDCG